MKMLVIDPGLRSGWATFDFTEEYFDIVSSGEVYEGVKGVQSLFSSLTDSYDVLVYEDFVLRGGVNGVNLAPVEVIGFLQSRQHLFSRIVKSSPSGRLVRCSDNALKRLGVYVPGEPRRNEREAIRHGIIYLKDVVGNKQVLFDGFIK